jgi:hypothetical protein
MCSTRGIRVTTIIRRNSGNPPPKKKKKKKNRNLRAAKNGAQVWCLAFACSRTRTRNQSPGVHGNNIHRTRGRGSPHSSRIIRERQADLGLLLRLDFRRRRRTAHSDARRRFMVRFFVLATAITDDDGLPFGDRRGRSGRVRRAGGKRK